MPPPRPRRRWLRLALITVGLCLAVDQIVNAVLLDDGYFRGERVAPFDPPFFNDKQVRAADFLSGRKQPESPPVQVFDRDLGWVMAPGPDPAAPRTDAVGARSDGSPVRRERTDGLRRIVVVGGSFTFGGEVDDHEAWPAMLEDHSPGWEIANLGVSGYGLDQAVLRWRRDGKPLDADEVWVGIFPSAIQRIVSIYRPANFHASGTILFKPRFLLRDDRLELLPLTFASAAEMVAVVEDQQRFLALTGENDWFVQRTLEAYEPFGSHWMHRFATTRLWLTRKDDERRLRTDDCFDDADGELSRLLDALVLQLGRDVAATGSTFRVVVLPGRSSLKHRRERASGASWDPLVRSWRAAGLDVTDVSADLVAGGVLEDRSFWAPGGHYSPTGNALVAEALAPLLAGP